MTPVDVRAHVAAIRALVTPHYPAHVVEVEGSPTYPYVLLWLSGRLVADSLCDEPADLDDTLGVTMVGLTADAVMAMQKILRDTLHGARPVVAGRSVELRLRDSRTIQADRDIQLTGSTAHPKFGVDLYRLVSVPA